MSFCLLSYNIFPYTLECQKCIRWNSSQCFLPIILPVLVVHESGVEAFSVLVDRRTSSINIWVSFDNFMIELRFYLQVASILMTQFRSNLSKALVLTNRFILFLALQYFYFFLCRRVCILSICRSLIFKIIFTFLAFTLI